MKTLKFADPLAELIAHGEKRKTWRVGDDKDLTEGDDLALIHNSSQRLFGRGTITAVDQRTFGTLLPEDFDGHEPFSGGQEQMLATYRGYYNDLNIGTDTPVTVVEFALWLLCNKPGDDETDVWIVR